MAKQKTIESYIGKIRNVGRNEVIVSLYDSRNTEILRTLPRNYFPEDKLKAGQTFQYSTTYSIEFIRPRNLSQLEIARIKGNIERRLHQ